MEIFKSMNLEEFTRRFPDDNSCKLYLAEVKWKDGFVCPKCGHTNYSERPDYTRTCTFCKRDESPTAGTAFHKVKFGIRKAFLILFEMLNSTKGMSASQISRRYGISRTTAWYFMQKMRRVMQSSGKYPLVGLVQVDEFTIGGQDEGKIGRSRDTKKKKVVSAVELTEDKKIKRVYSMTIDDFSSKSLSKFFRLYISEQAHIKTDKWSGYKPLKKRYNIEQVDSENGRGLKQFHVIAHQIKSWMRSIYSWVSKEHLDYYLAEYSFRFYCPSIIFNSIIFFSKRTPRN